MAAEGGQHRVVAAELLGQCRLVEHVGLDRCEIRLRGQLLGVGDERRHAVAARQRFFQKSRTDEAAGTNESDVHRISPKRMGQGGDEALRGLCRQPSWTASIEMEPPSKPSTGKLTGSCA